MDVGVRNVCGPMKCSHSRLDWIHSDPSLTQSMRVLWIMCSFFSCTKDLKAVVFLFVCLFFKHIPYLFASVC